MNSKTFFKRNALQFLFFSILSVFLSMQSMAQYTITGDVVVCEGDFDTYSVNTTGSWNYMWTVTNGASSLPTSNPTHITWAGPGTGTIMCVIDSISGGNHDTVYLNVTIHPKPTPKIHADKTYGCVTVDEHGNEVPVSPDCLTTCDTTWVNYHTKLNAGSTYQWSINGTYLNTPVLSNNTLSVHWGPAGSGKLTVKETSANGCVAEYEVCIEIIKRPDAKFTVSPQSSIIPHQLCLGTNVSFFDQSTDAVKWFWDFDDPMSGTANFSHVKNPQHQYNTPGMYVAKLVVENKCHCTDTFLYQFNVLPDPAHEIRCAGVVCENGTVEYYTPSIGCPIYHWSVSSNGIITTPPNWGPSIQVLWTSGPIGTVSLWTNCPGACNDTVSITVQVIPDTIAIEGDKRVCVGEQSKLWIHCLPGADLTWHQYNGPDLGTSASSVTHFKEHYYNWATPGKDTIDIEYFNSVLGCGGLGKTVVNVLNKFSVTGPKSACLWGTSTYTPSSSPSNTYDWILLDSAGNVIYNLTGATGPHTTPNWMWAGEFKLLTVNNSGLYCNDTVETTIKIFDKPPLPNPIVGDTMICPGKTSSFFSYPTDPQYYLEWHAVNGVITPAYGTNPSFKWGPSGPYQVKLIQRHKVAPFCPSDTVSITLTPKAPNPNATIVGNATPCNNSLESYSTPDTADDYFWEIIPATMGSVIAGQYSDSIDVQWNNATGSATLRLYLTVCDSTVIVNKSITVGFGPTLTMSPTLPQTFCAGTNPGFSASMGGPASFSWYLDGSSIGIGSSLSHTFPTAGTYTLKVTGQANGCNASQSVSGIVTVKPSPVASISRQFNHQICIPDSIFDTLHLSYQNGTSIQWFQAGGTVLNGGAAYVPGVLNHGSYYAVVTNTNGCSATSNIISLGDSCQGKGNCLGPDSVTWDSASIAVNCGAINLQAYFTGTALMYGWQGGTLNSTTLSSSKGAAGYYHYTFWWMEPDSCTYEEVVTAKVPLTADFDYTLSCVGGGQYKYEFFDRSTSLGTTITRTWSGSLSGSSATPTATWSSGTSHTVTLSVTTAGKTCTQTVNITVPTLAASFTLSPNPVCEGNPVQFTSTSSGAGSHFWEFGDLAELKGSSSPSRVYKHSGSPSSPKNYVALLIVDGIYGCKDTASNAVSIYKNHIKDTGLVDWTPTLKYLKLCQGSNGTIGISYDPTFLGYGPNYPLSFNWSNAFSQSGTITSSSQVVNQSGNYTVEVTDNMGCYGHHKSISVDITNIPKPVIYGDHDICYGTHTWNANVGSTFSYQWTLNGAVLPGASASTTQSFQSIPGPGTYWLQVEVSLAGSSCTSKSDSFKIVVHAPPAAPVLSSNPTPACENQVPVTLTASVGGSISQVNWSNGAIGNPIQVNAKGVYVATVVDTFGCTNSDKIEVHAVPEMCYFMCGCYVFCDTISSLWLPGIPGSYASWDWVSNGTIHTSGTGTISPVDLTTIGGGEIYLVVTNNAGCTDTSCLFEYSFEPCDGELIEPCDGDYHLFEVRCDSPYTQYDYNYRISLMYFYTGCNNSTLTVTSSLGTPVGFPITINNGSNGISGVLNFPFSAPPSGNICLTFTIMDGCTGQLCSFTRCWDEWNCDTLALYPPGAPPESGPEGDSEFGDTPNNQDYSPNELKVYPNPGTDMIMLWYRCEQEQGCKLQVTNNQGVVVREFELPNESSQIIFNQGQLPPGMYTVRLVDEHSVIRKRAIMLE